MTALLRETGPRLRRLLPILAAVFLFNVGVSAWPAVVAGRAMQQGDSTGLLGTLYAVCEVVRLPAVLLLPALTLRFGARRITQAGLLGLLLVPLAALDGLNGQRAMLSLVLSAVPAMAVYVGLPAFTIGAAREGDEGWALALLGLVGGAGGALGPWIGGLMTDAYGPLPAFAMQAVSCALVLPVVMRAKLPAPSGWAGWSALAGRGVPWQALGALVLASAADAGRAALVPSELVRQGLPLGDVGFLLGAGCAVAGVGFLAFGYLGNQHSPVRVVGAGLLVMAAGSLAAACTSQWCVPFAFSAAVLGLGASGIRLGASLSLVSWLGRDRAAVAAALAEVAMLGGRALGAPTLGALGDARGGDVAFQAVGMIGLLVALLLGLAASGRHVRLRLPGGRSGPALAPVPVRH